MTPDNSLLTYITVGPALVIGILAVVVFSIAALKMGPLMNGIVGGLIFSVIGMGLIFGPAFYLIDTSTEKTVGLIILSVFAIVLGCVSSLFGAAKLTNFGDF